MTRYDDPQGDGRDRVRAMVRAVEEVASMEARLSGSLSMEATRLHPMADAPMDRVDRIVAEWERERPDLDGVTAAADRSAAPARGALTERLLRYTPSSGS